MPVRVVLLSTAHVHAPSYASCLRELVGGGLCGVWDDDAHRGKAFAERFETTFVHDLNAAIEASDAVIIASENAHHVDLAVKAASAGKHILCEKPLVTTEDEGLRLLETVKSAGVKLMTAFPCPFSPTFVRVLERIDAGEIGKLLAVCATNRGTCPGSWFVDKTLSGGGAMIDHVVHVADLLWRMLKQEPATVFAHAGNNMYGLDCEDSAILSLSYPSGVFASLDSSWSRPKGYKTWGDVGMNIVGEDGVIEIDLFRQSLYVYEKRSAGLSLHGYGSNLDLAMVSEFLDSISEDREPSVTGEDGLRACRVAFAAYESVRTGVPTTMSQSSFSTLTRSKP